MHGQVRRGMIEPRLVHEPFLQAVDDGAAAARDVVAGKRLVCSIQLAGARARLLLPNELLHQGALPPAFLRRPAASTLPCPHLRL